MLSVIVIVKNAEQHLRKCLNSVRWADEIVVLDSGSADGSLAIAKEFTEKVYSTDWPGYGRQKQRALEFATGDWVLNIDADEWVTDALRKELCQVIQHDTAGAYRVPILLNFYGKSLSYSWSPKHHVRLFKRKGACYTDQIVHESVLLPPKTKIGQFKSGIQHDCIQDITHALTKMNTYSSCSASLRKDLRSKPPSFTKIVLSAIWMFVRCYVIQGGFLEGKDGFLLAVLSAEGSFYRGIKQIYPDASSGLSAP